MNPYVIAFLVISLLANAGLGYALKGAWEDKATAESQREGAVASAKSCSDGVAALEAEAKDKQAKAEIAIRNAQEAAKSAIQRAQKTLALSATNTSDLCASAASLNAAKIRERKQK